MPSPKAKNPSRSGGSPVLGGTGGRCDFMPLTKPLNRPSPQSHLLQRQGSDPTTARLRASESPTRRRGSSSSTGSASGQGLSDEDGIRLNPTFLGVALSSLLAVDLWLSKRMGVCACEDSSWGSVRPLMKLIEISGHGVPWLAGTAYCLYKSDTVAGQEVMLNLLIGKSLSSRDDYHSQEFIYYMSLPNLLICTSQLSCTHLSLLCVCWPSTEAPPKFFCTVFLVT